MAWFVVACCFARREKKEPVKSQEESPELEERAGVSTVSRFENPPHCSSEHRMSLKVDLSKNGHKGVRLHPYSITLAYMPISGIDSLKS